MPLGYNDGILLLSLLYSSIDIRYEWESFSTCRRPIHQWLFVSFALVITFRLTHVLGMKTATLGSGDFLLDLRQKGTLPRCFGFLHLACRPALLHTLDSCWHKVALGHSPGDSFLRAHFDAFVVFYILAGPLLCLDPHPCSSWRCGLAPRAACEARRG